MVIELMEALDHVGVLALELFEVDGADGSVEVLANEIAPRVHNSGHWTIEGAVTSQFEQHLRAVCGWSLGDPAASAPERHGEPDRWRAGPGRGAGRRPEPTSTATARRLAPAARSATSPCWAADEQDRDERLAAVRALAEATAEG